MQVLAFTRRAGIIAVVLLGILSGAAHAATAFGPPVPVSAFAAAVTDPHVFFSVDGRGLVSWNARVPLTAPYQEPRGRTASVAADGTVIGGAALSDTLASPILREYPPEHALVLREQVLARDDRLARVRLSVASVRPDASVDRGQVITTVTRQEAPRLVVDDDGRAVLAWIELLPQRRGQRAQTYRLRVSERQPGERFGAPRTLEQAVDGGSLTTLAAGIQSGRAVLAYSRTRVGAHGRLVSRTVETRTRDATRGWGRPQVLTRTGTASDISIAVALGGRAYVVWRTQQGGLGNPGSWWIRAAVLPRGARHFRSAGELDRGRSSEIAPGRLVVGVSHAGQATAAWSAIYPLSVNFAAPVRVATTGAATRFGPFAQLSPDGELGDLVAGADGKVLVTWGITTSGLGPAHGIAAAIREPSATAFADAVLVTAGEGTVSLPAAALGQVNSQAAIVWSAQPRGGPARLWFARAS
jgi:hypothetical protein